MQVKSGVAQTYWAVLVIAVIVTFAAAYALGSGVGSGRSAATSSDQALIGALESQNAQLSSELAAKTTTANSTGLGLDTVGIYNSASPGIVTIQGDSALGSGFVMSYGGAFYIVTNYHVVNGQSGITVTFQDGDAYPATVVGTDGYSDLAVLKLTAPVSEYHPLQVASSSSLVVGQPVAAIGNPLGLSGSITVGIVSQLGRTLTETLAGNFAIADVIQFSAQINPGNSGGPLLDAGGAVVGITTAVPEISPGVLAQGVGFAIPSDTILRELPSLISAGSYNLHPLMGITGADMNYQLAQLQDTNYTYGVLIQNITSGGPADRAGLKAGAQQDTVQGNAYYIGGDIIISMNGTKIVNTDALSSYLAEYAQAGQTVVLTIVRGGHLTTVDLVLGTRPPPPS